MENEDDIEFFIVACIILHNKCLDHGDEGDDMLPEEDSTIVVSSSATSAGKKKRDALLAYALRNRH